MFHSGVLPAAANNFSIFLDRKVDNSSAPEVLPCATAQLKPSLGVYVHACLWEFKHRCTGVWVSAFVQLQGPFLKLNQYPGSPAEH